MNQFSRHSLVRGFALGAAFACLASTAALAEPSGGDPAPSWLDQRVKGLEQKLAFFGSRDEPTTGQSNIQTAQSSMADIAVRLDRLENQMRQLNGRIEELQFQGKKNEDALKRAQDDTDFRLKDLESGKGGGGGGSGASGSGGGGGSPKPQRRGDAGDPSTGGGSRSGDISVGSNGGGSGAPPATLGQTRSSGGGGGGGDQIGGLIDQGGPGDDPNGPMSIRPPGAGGGGGGRPSGGGDYGDRGGDDSRVASRGDASSSVTAGSGSPRDQFDLGVGFVQRRNYDQAEATFRDFLRNNPNDAKAPEATYWLGESLYQRKKYADAVENFLKIYTTAPNSAKAPESMLKLGMALNGMGKKEEACGTLDAAGKKYARIKPQSDRELKRISC